MLGRNRKKEQDAQEGVPPPPPPAPNEQPQAQANDAQADADSGGGIVSYLRDTYNGLYKITLQPSMPSWSEVILVVCGLLVGLAWGYLLQPPIFTGANPQRLNQAAQDQWVKMVAVGFDTESRYGIEETLALLDRVDDPSAVVERLLANDATAPNDRQALRILQNSIAELPAGTPTPTSPGLAQDALNSLVVPVLALMIILPIWYLLWRLIIQPGVWQPVQKRIRVMRDPEFRKQQEGLAKQRALRKQEIAMREAMTQEAPDLELGTPVMQALSVFDRDLPFDDSKEIEDDAGMFLGQCGAVIAEVVEPDPVAIELWLFDLANQADSKVVFTTDAGYNDAAIRGKLEGEVKNPATDIVVAKPGAKLRIDSESLVLEGEIASVDVGDDGRFNTFRMKMQAWRKDGSGAAASPDAPPPIPEPAPLPDYSNMQLDPPPVPPAQQNAPPGAPDMSEYDNMQFDPPPIPPGQQQPPPSLGSMMQGQTEETYPNAPSPPTPPGAPDMSEYDNMEFDPPPVPPGQQQPPAQQSGRLTPPPLNYPPPGFGAPSDEEDDDDPFGSAGDFTPLPR